MSSRTRPDFDSHKPTGVIDIGAINTVTRQVELHIVDEHDWSDCLAHCEWLRGRMNLYIAYVCGGQMARQEPAYAGRPVKFILDSRLEPPQDAIRVLQRMKKHLLKLGIGFGVTLHGNLAKELDLGTISGSEEC